MDHSLKTRDQLLQEVEQLRQQVVDLEGVEKKRQDAEKALTRVQDALEYHVNEQASQLRASEARYRALVEGSLQGILIHRDFKPLFVNQAYADIFGYDSPADILQSDNIVHLVADRHEHDRLLKYGTARSFTGKVPTRYEYRGIRRDGKPIWLLNFVSLTMWDQGPAIQTVSLDITARKQAEQTLSEREQQFRDLAEGSIQGILIHRGGKPVFVNQAYADVFGYETPDDIIRMPDIIRSLVAPEDRLQLYHYREAREREEEAPRSYEYRGVRQDGSRVWVRNVVRMVRWEGKPAIQATIIDITAQQQAQQALQALNQTLEQEVVARTAELTTTNLQLRRAMRETKQVQKALFEREQQFRDLVEGSVQGVMIHRDFKVLFVNRSYAEIFGYDSPSEFFQDADLLQTVAPEDRERLELYMKKRHWGEAAPSHYEYQGIRRDGKTIRLSNTARLVRWEGEAAIQATVVDVTARQEAEAALWVSEARFRAAFESAAIGMSQVSLDGRFLTSNKAMQAMLGYQGNELLGMSIIEITHPEDVDLHVDFFHEARHGRREYFEAEKRYCCKNGDVIWAHVTASLVRDELGKPAFIIGLIVDITTRKQLDIQLRQSERLAAFGTFAAGVAHELNNPLGAIQITTEHAQNVLAGGHGTREVDECLGDILDASQRCAQIVKRVLNFAQPANRVKSLVSLHPLIHLVERHTRQYVKLQGGEVVLTFATEEPFVIAHEEEIELVLVNLVRNASEASDTGGAITIRTEVGNQEVLVSVHNTGPSLTEAEQRRVFDPFYTTRGASGGTGLGLSIVHRIITDHGGRIKLESGFERGVTVQFWLPLGQAPTTPQCARENAP